MRIAMDCGFDHLEFEVADDRVISHLQPPPALTDPVAAVRAALEQPYAFPALRRALTPDDHITIVVDEELPHLAELLVPLLEHIQSAGVAPESMTLLCPPSASRQAWIEDLPEDFQDVHVEMSDPDDRRHMAYLATMHKGKRLYLNRTLVESDQIVVLSGRRYDPLLGYGGAEGALYPAMSDKETREEMSHRVNLGLPEAAPGPALRAATETAWLLGAPFFVQVIESGGDGVAQVVAGTSEASREGERLLDASWRRRVPEAAELVIAGLSGDPTRHTFASLSAALACAARVVRPGGRIALLTKAAPELGTAAELLRAADDPQELLQRLRGKQTVEMVPVLQWAGAANQARINLLSGLTDETVEELFATPLHEAREIQRLLDAGGSCLFLPDAHKMLAVVTDDYPQKT
ncbi:MAG TPA: lactate racemase domain-containing protein [Gemmataceae bacterium]|nr:lactate racemase domain-containing protein [Gemmataceae bacterium]